MDMNMGTSSTASAMSMSATGSVNMTNLPLSDPSCSNETCLAYAAAEAASQAQVSWASQFEYGHYTAYFFSIIIFIFALSYAAQRLNSRYVSYPSSRTTSIQKLKALVRSVTYRRTGIGMSLGMAGLIFICVLFATIATFTQRPYYRVRRGYGSPPLAVRTGLMAVALTPVIIALSGKYNVVTLVTGISHERLNVLHRYVAYICLALSVVHTIPFIVQPLKEGGFRALHNQFYSPGGMEYTGTPPLGILVFLCLFSIPWLRHRFYEAFAHSHIIAAIIYLGLMFWHAAKSLDSWNYLWATVAIWLFSLFGRFLVKLPTPSGRTAQASLEEIDGEALRITVPAFDVLNWRPGQHVFLRFPTIAPLDNHPFTIASVSDETYVTGKDGETTRTPMMFLVKPQQGITRKLMKITQQQPGRKMKVLVEGPYGGHNQNLELAYESVILVAGGSGITAVLPLLTHLSRKIGRRNTVLKEVKLVWAVKQKHSISWVQKELAEALAAAPGSVTIDYYVTSEGNTSSSSSLHSQDIENGMRRTSMAGEKLVEIHQPSRDFGPGTFGRPAFRELFPCILGQPRTYVIGCGPKAMNEALSNAVVASQKRVLSGEIQEVGLHTETFGW